MNNWSLEVLYHDFDATFTNDLELLSQKIDECVSRSTQLKDAETLEKYLKLHAEIDKLALNLMAYTHLRLATNANDTQATKYMGALLDVLGKTARPEATFTKWLHQNKESFNQWVQENAYIKEHEFILQERIHNADYALSEEVEEAIYLMKINGSEAWSQLQSHLTSFASIEFRGEKHTLTSLRNFAYDNDPEIRKEAYAKELELYTQIEDSIAFALNSIKGQVIQTNRLRGYASPLEETLRKSRISQETLDALLTAIENKLPVFRKYLKHKAKVLGHKNGLPWYDLFAPYEVKNTKEYSIEDSRTMITECFASFSEDLSQMAARAYDHQWIDFLPYEGKRGGAFCMNLPHVKQSRILTNYGFTISDIVTLAHELGHAYHGMMLENNSILNTDYTMPVAETASTFCENIVFNAAMKTAEDDEKIMLIENSLQDLTQITVDILSRFKFEKNVFDRRQSEFLNTSSLKEIMLQAQKDTYGDGLDESTLHPYMWICKGHYYSAESNFYNFPYAFGGLFALGLYAQYQQNGESFVPKYQDLLKATATATCEDVARKAGVDTTQVSFWESSIDIIEQRVDQYIKLTSK